MKGDFPGEAQYYYEVVKLGVLVLTMLDYGAMAQLAFDRDVDNLANGSNASLFNDPVTPAMIKSYSDDMSDGLEAYGLQYDYSTVVYLSKTSLKHYYTITDESLFNEVKDTVTFSDIDANQTVRTIQSGNRVCFELKNISAKNLDTRYTLVIGENSYRHSVMDYIKRLLDSDNDKKFIDLGKATYRYNEAANDYFGQ